MTRKQTGKTNKRKNGGPKQSSAPSRPSKSRSSTIVRPSFGLSPCAAKFAAAQANPWSPEAQGACIPQVPARPSRKAIGFIRGTAYVGTNGFGFISVSPTVANDPPSLNYTTAAFTGGDTNVLNSSNVPIAGVEQGFAQNLPFATSTIAPANNDYQAYATGRIISAGLRVNYIGTELNLGGEYYIYSDANHYDTTGNSANSLGTYAECRIQPVTRTKVFLTSGPISDEECSYPEQAGNQTAATIAERKYPWSRGMNIQNQSGGISTSTSGPCPMVIAFTGTAGNPFHFDYIIHTEFVGLPAQGALTKNSADPVGLANVMAARDRAEQLAQVSKTDYAKLFMQALNAIGTENVMLAGRMLEKVVIGSGGNSAPVFSAMNPY